MESHGYGWGGGGFLSEAGLRERAQAEGRVSGAGGREFEFGLFGVGTLVLLQDPAARRATVDGHVRGRNGPDAAKIRQCDQGNRFGRAFLATFARHWYTGVRFGAAILERFLNTLEARVEHG